MDYNQIAFDDYVDSSDTVKLAIIHKKTSKDIKLQEAMISAYKKGPDIRLLKINCDNVDKILQSVSKKDQENRNGGHRPLESVDFRNLEVVINIINQCNLPEQIFFLDLPTFMEAQKKNIGLNKKVCIDFMGELKNDFTHKKSFGNI